MIIFFIDNGVNDISHLFSDIPTLRFKVIKILLNDFLDQLKYNSH